jgi:hypothetical protein
MDLLRDIHKHFLTAAVKSGDGQSFSFRAIRQQLRLSETDADDILGTLAESGAVELIYGDQQMIDRRGREMVRAWEEDAARKRPPKSGAQKIDPDKPFNRPSAVVRPPTIPPAKADPIPIAIDEAVKDRLDLKETVSATVNDGSPIETTSPPTSHPTRPSIPPAASESVTAQLKWLESVKSSGVEHERLAEMMASHAARHSNDDPFEQNFKRLADEFMRDQAQQKNEALTEVSRQAREKKGLEHRHAEGRSPDAKALFAKHGEQFMVWGGSAVGR